MCIANQKIIILSSGFKSRKKKPPLLVVSSYILRYLSIKEILTCYKFISKRKSPLKQSTHKKCNLKWIIINIF